MKILLFLILNLIALSSLSQTTCFGTDQIPMLDVIELQEKGATIPLHILQTHECQISDLKYAQK
jgi:hypothetical protein